MPHLLTTKYGGMTFKKCTAVHSSQEMFPRGFSPGIDGQIEAEGRAD